MIKENINELTERVDTLERQVVDLEDQMNKLLKHLKEATT